MSLYAKVNDQSFNETLTNDIVSFEHNWALIAFLYLICTAYDVRRILVLLVGFVLWL